MPRKWHVRFCRRVVPARVRLSSTHECWDWAGVAGDRTELVQELALLASAGMRVARRQSPRQVVPTSLLHTLIVVVTGRILSEANHLRWVGLFSEATRREQAGVQPMIVELSGGTGK